MSFQSSQVRLFRGVSRTTLAVAALAVLGVLWAVFLVGGIFAVAVLGSLSGLVGPFLAVGLVAYLRRGRQTMAGELRANEHGVLWDERMLVARSNITGGFVVPSDGGPPEVRLLQSFPRGKVELQVPSEASGRALLAALGLDAAQTIASIKLAPLARAWSYSTLCNVASIPASIAALIAVSFVGSPGAILVASVLGAFVALWLTLNVLPARARVGADGVLVQWLGRRTFHRFEDLTGARMFVGSGTAGVVLEQRAAPDVRLPMLGLFSAQMDRDEITLAVKRIEQAAEVHRLAQADRSVSLPTRGARSTTEWLRALRAMGSGASADHRRAPVAEDTLFRIAEDPGSEPQRRLAAALALGASVGSGGRERLRIAAASTAAPELREALELAAAESSSEEALAAAIDRLPLHLDDR